MDNKQQKDSTKTFIQCVFIDGILKLGAIAILFYLFIDFVVDYSFTGVVPHYSNDHYIRTSATGGGLGLTVGLINWFLIQKSAGK